MFKTKEQMFLSMCFLYENIELLFKQYAARKHHFSFTFYFFKSFWGSPRKSVDAIYPLQSNLLRKN